MRKTEDSIMNQTEMILATLEEIKDLLHGKTKKCYMIDYPRQMNKFAGVV